VAAVVAGDNKSNCLEGPGSWQPSGRRRARLPGRLRVRATAPPSKT